MKICVCIVAICFSVTISSRADDRTRDGVYWRSMPESSKTMYVLGLIDGFTGGDFFVPAPSPESLVDYHAKLREMIGKSSVGTLKDGLDRFYEDFRNRNIKVYRAIAVVSAQVNGASDEKAQRLMEHLRQWKDQ